MRNNQYWVSTTSPYAPRLNFFLAYQYCRNLGLQLLTFETQEEMDSLTSYLAQSYSGNNFNFKQFIFSLLVYSQQQLVS